MNQYYTTEKLDFELFRLGIIFGNDSDFRYGEFGIFNFLLRSASPGWITTGNYLWIKGKKYLIRLKEANYYK